MSISTNLLNAIAKFLANKAAKIHKINNVRVKIPLDDNNIAIKIKGRENMLCLKTIKSFIFNKIVFIVLINYLLL